MPIYQADYMTGLLKQTILYSKIRFVGCFGPIGVQYHFQHYFEFPEKDQMMIQSSYIINRMRFRKYFIFGIGLDSSMISGTNVNYGMSITFPIQISFDPNFHLLYQNINHFLNEVPTGELSLRLVYKKECLSYTFSFNGSYTEDMSIQGAS